MANNSRYLLKSNGVQLNADELVGTPIYPAGSYQTFTENMGVNATSVYGSSRIFYPVTIRNNCTLDLSMLQVTINGTPTAGAKISIVMATLVDQTTMQIYRNLGEFDATVTTVQSLSINESIVSGNYWIGIQHSNVATITIFANSVACLSNLQATPSSSNMANYNLKAHSAGYTYPHTIGANITVSDTTPGTPNFAIAKFRIV